MIVMNLKGLIKGDCLLKGYTDWITIDDVSWDINREPKESSKGGSSDLYMGVPECSPVNVTKTMDVSSVDMIRFATRGFPIDLLEIHFISTGLDSAKKDEYVTFMKIELQRAVVKKWGINASGDDRPTESIEIMYNTIKISYDWYKDGKIKTAVPPAGWDMVQGQPAS